jgi:hypothetical protein
MDAKALPSDGQTTSMRWPDRASTDLPSMSCMKAFSHGGRQMRAHAGVLRKTAKFVSHVAEESLATQDAALGTGDSVLFSASANFPTPRPVHGKKVNCPRHCLIVRCDTKALVILNRLDYGTAIVAEQFEKSV